VVLKAMLLILMNLNVEGAAWEACISDLEGGKHIICCKTEENEECLRRVPSIRTSVMLTDFQPAVR
jgi:hypothetical protein